MAMIYCRECHTEISKNAEKCPSCGSRNLYVLNPAKWLFIAMILAVIGYFAFTAVSCMQSAGNAASQYKDDMDRIDASRESERLAEQQAATQTDSSAGNSAPVASSSPDQVAMIAIKQAPIAVTATKLYAAYDANEVAADNIYKDKLLAVSGMVTDISKDYSDAITVQISDDGVNSDWGWVAKGEETKAAKLRKLDYIILNSA